jgi:hypothetical protein
MYALISALHWFACPDPSQNTGRIDSKIFAQLAEDASRLLSPTRVVELANVASPNDLTTHPSSSILLVLSDLRQIFSSGDGKVNKETPAGLKLTFYAAQVIRTPPAILDFVSRQLESRAQSERESSH